MLRCERGKRHRGEDEAASDVWYSIRRISRTGTARRSACSAATSRSGSSLCVRWRGWLRGQSIMPFTSCALLCRWLAVGAHSPTTAGRRARLGIARTSYTTNACHCNFSTLRSARLDRRLVHQVASTYSEWPSTSCDRHTPCLLFRFPVLQRTCSPNLGTSIRALAR